MTRCGAGWFSVGLSQSTPAARYHLTVIGAGPAGLVTAIAAAVWARESRWWSGMPWEETA